MTAESNGSLALVTGAGGFIGSALVARLHQAGRPVRACSRRTLPALSEQGVNVAVADLLDAAALREACRGVRTVFHTAGRVGVWGPADEYYRVNVEGTAALLEAARQAGVERFVFTSSPAVVFRGGPLSGADESAPLCTRSSCAYAPSKAAAEQLVRAANSPAFRTVALRPHLVWGPGDHHLVPRVVALARAGRLRIVGDGRNRVDLTHIENVLDAHLLAERALDGAQPAAAGRAYFITNDEPVELWAWINEVLSRLGQPPLRRHVSRRTAITLGACCEVLWSIFPLHGEPPMTRFAAEQMSLDHWFSIAAARRDLGYTPRISMAEGMADLIKRLA